MSKRRVLLIVLLVCVRSAAERQPLMPRPQRIEYGTGQLAVRGLSIRHASVPAVEDRFTAARLAAALSRGAGAPIPVWEGQAEGKGIVLNRSGVVDALPAPGEHAGPDAREAYSLTITSEGVEIKSRSSAGLYYGAETLVQLIEDAAGQPVLPHVRIQDWPAFPYRAVMMDMSHGPLPTEEEVKRQIDAVARWKGNQYYFYSETSIELQGYPLLSPDARFTADQVKRIIDYARDRHVDVIPCVELYGHLHDLFRIEQYAGLTVLPHGGDFNARDPRTAAVIADWVDQLARMFPSPYFHIGLDEPYDLEKSAEIAGMPASKIYLDQLAKVAGMVSRRGKHVVFWADAANIFGPHPDVLEALPAGITAVPWKNGYVKSYEAFLAPFARLHVPAYASTSVLNYVQVAPDFNQTFAAVDALMADARKFRAVGLLLTLWVDAQNLTRPALPGVAYGMAACWQSTPVVRADFFSEYARRTLPGAAALELAPALQALSDAETVLQKAVGFNSMGRLWADALSSRNLELAQKRREEFRQVRLNAEKAETHLRQALSLKGDPDSLANLLVAARMLDYAGMKYLYAAEMADAWKQLGQHPSRRDLGFYYSRIAGEGHSLTDDLMLGIATLQDAYRAAWLSEYTPYQLRAASLKWNHEYEYWSGVARQFAKLRAEYRDGMALPPLESLATK